MAPDRTSHVSRNCAAAPKLVSPMGRRGGGGVGGGGGGGGRGGGGGGGGGGGWGGGGVSPLTPPPLPDFYLWDPVISIGAGRWCHICP